MQTLTPVGEFAFVSVFRPAAPMEGSQNKDPQYQLTILWDEDDPKLRKLEKKIEEVAVAKWGAKAKTMLEKGQLKNPLRDGNERSADWMEGKRFMTARSNDRPDVVDADLEDIIDERKVYAGAIGRMDVWLYAFDKAGNKGVGAILNNVQVTDEGERKGGRRDAASAFNDDDDDDEDDRPARRSSSRSRREEPEEEEAPRRRPRPRR